LGFQFIMTGLLAEIISRIYFVTHRTKIYTIEEIKSRREIEDEE